MKQSEILKVLESQFDFEIRERVKYHSFFELNPKWISPRPGGDNSQILKWDTDSKRLAKILIQAIKNKKIKLSV
jgi:hypothetical protein